MFSFGVDDGDGKETRAMRINIGLQGVLVEPVDQWRPLLRDMGITEVLTDNRGVVAFRQGIIVAMSAVKN